MFSDLVGSTALSARMDPEDLREVISAYQKWVAETVRASSGFVAKYMGDGVLIYFGYPQGPRGRCRTGGTRGAGVGHCGRGLKTHVPADTRRHRTGSSGCRRPDRLGRFSGASNRWRDAELAARLQGVAEPNMVVIAEGTRRLLGNLFELEDLGAKDLKGIAGPVRAFAALRASSAEGRFEAMHGAA